MADPTNWVVPSVTDLRAVLMEKLQIVAGSSYASTERTTPLLSMMVARVRGAVRAGGRTPLSSTAGSIPPEAVFHCMILTARALVDSVPQLARASKLTDDFTKMVYWSEQWLHSVETGKSVTPPDDPDEDTTPSGASFGGDTFVSMASD